MGNQKNEYKIGIVFFILASFCYSTLHGQNDLNEDNGLAEAFGQIAESESVEPTEEIEPTVLGREKWSDKPKDETLPSAKKDQTTSVSRISELDALETKQIKLPINDLPLEPPSTPPAVNLDRNFEGKLVLKPRKLGFENLYPYQLENYRGKRLAFLDLGNLRVFDPLDFEGKKVSILGKLEPIEKNSTELVIRARLLREID